MKITANCCEITKSVWVYMYTFWEGLLSNEFRNFLEKKCAEHTIQHRMVWPSMSQGYINLYYILYKKLFFFAPYDLESH